VFASLLREEVENQKSDVPLAYQKAWALTALTLVNMTAEAMRSDSDAIALLTEPRTVIGDEPKTKALLSPFVAASCAVLRDRAAEFIAKNAADDFKVAFKHTRTLTELGMRASKSFRSRRRISAS
jgi:hypothetical protein